MKPLDEEIDVKKTRARVQKHMRSFQRMKFMVSVEDMSASSGGIIKTPNDDTATNPSSTPMLAVLEKTTKENQRIEDYLEFIIKSINKLDSYDRKIILMKYFYMMDEEELQNELGYAEKRTLGVVKDAEVSLAYVLNCVLFKAKKPIK